MDLTLYSYWRSSAAYRVRIALNLKGAAYEQIAVNIAPKVLEHRGDSYRAINPQMRVPTLLVNGEPLTQSMAMLEWIEETLSGPTLLPVEPLARVRCRAFAQTIVSDIHPVQNMSVLASLRSDYGADDEGVRAWIHGVMTRGFEALETMARARADTQFLFGDRPTFADICLVPQLYNARRFAVPLEPYPRLLEIDAAARALPAFEAAAPESQPDAPDPA
ncbi:MAG: maleylacetoacetate isomerase [Pseudomonadota bacterium]